MGHTWTVNRVALQGYLGADPAQGSSSSGKLTATFGVVTETAEGVRECSEVRAYAKTAQAVLNGCKAGSRVYVEGRLREGRVLAYDVRFLDGPVSRGGT